MWRVAFIAWWIVLAACIGFSIYRNLLVVSSDPFDEPIAVISAARVVKGEMPFRDFDAYYGPVGHYLDALAIVGQPWLSSTKACQSWFFLVSLGILALLGWWIPRLVRGKAWLLIWATIFLGLFGPMIGRFSFHSGIELLLVLATLLLIPGDLGGPLPLGSAVALAFLDVVLFATKINFGVYAIAAASFLLLIDLVLFRRPGAVRCLAVYCSALLAFGVIFAGVMWVSGMLHPYESIIWDAIRLNYARHRALGTLAPPFLLQCLGLLFSFFVLGVMAVFDPKLRRSQTFIYSLALSAGFAQYAVFRFDRYHGFFLLFGLFVALLTVLSLYSDSRRQRGLPFLAGLGLAILLIAALPDTLVYRITNALPPRFKASEMDDSAPVRIGRPQRQVVSDGVAITANEARMTSSLRSLMNPGDEVFWASKPGSCQSSIDMCVNHALYLAMDKLPTTRYWMFDVVTSQYAEFQQQMVHDLEARKVRFIGVQENINHTPLGSNPPESHVLYDFVRAHYDLVGIFSAPERGEQFEIYRLKPNK